MATLKYLENVGMTVSEPGDRPVWAGNYRVFSKDLNRFTGRTASGNSKQRRATIRDWKLKGLEVGQQWYRVQTNELGLHVIVGRYYKEV